jgi:hypothetical protein
LDEPDIMTKNEVFYERLLNGVMRLRVGGAYLLANRSWFNLVFTLSHELAHAIDPCEIRAALLSFPAYANLSACFFQQKWIVLSKSRVECGENDQLSEIFADWIAVKLTAEALKVFSTEFDQNQIRRAAKNSVRDLCEQEDDPLEIDTQFHPHPRIRIGIILGYQSEIRSLIGCETVATTTHYCSFESNILSTGLTPIDSKKIRKTSHHSHPVTETPREIYED